MTELVEQWRPIEGYEGLYEVSNLGRVKSLGNDKNRKEKILRPVMTKKGYLQLFLSKEGKAKRFFVHRLVAQAFIPNPEGLPQINHKDENPSNNRVENIEWCDCKYNINYGTHKERQVQTGISKGLYDPEMCGVIKNEGMKEYQRMWYQKNREKKLEQGRQWYQKNKDKRNEYMREYQREYRRRKKQKQTA